ncbi:MAG TPA: glycosyltransferase [Membranihabitans sp.]|nr:glycosyltransferase [Membranihabitans sp.]
MNVLVIISGSLGHYHGIRRFFDYFNSANDYKILYAFHGFTNKNQELNPDQYFLNSYPAFLNYEFRYTKKPSEIYKLKRDDIIRKNRTHTFRKLFELFHPDVILLDNHAFTDGFLIKKEFTNLHSKTLFFQTRLSTELGVDTFYGSYKGKKLKWISSNKILTHQKLKRIWYRLLMPGYSKYHQLDSYKKGMNLQLNYQRYRLPSVSNIPEIIISGKNLSKYTTINQHFFGLCISPKIEEDKKPNPIQILVSAGSVATINIYFSRYISLVQKIIARLPQFHFVLPEGITLARKFPNISFYTWEEYQDVLSSSHIHITHGGINSIKDSLTYGIPFLVCPIDWQSDSIHNALLFNELKLSKIWNIQTDDEECVIRKLEELTDKKYSKRIKEFIYLDNSQYKPNDVGIAFDSLIRNENWSVSHWP